MNKFIKLFFLNKFNKFLIGGVFNFLIKLGLTIFLTEIMHLWYFVSYIITLGITITFSFFYSAYITFKVVSNKRQNFIKYSFTLALFSITDAISVKFLTEYLKLHYTLSIISITAILFVLKFLVYGKFVFTRQNQKLQ